jgi:hypothetical protein
MELLQFAEYLELPFFTVDLPFNFHLIDSALQPVMLVDSNWDVLLVG